MQMLTSVKQKVLFNHSFLSFIFLLRMIMCVLHVFVSDLPQLHFPVNKLFSRFLPNHLKLSNVLVSDIDKAELKLAIIKLHELD